MQADNNSPDSVLLVGSQLLDQSIRVRIRVELALAEPFVVEQRLRDSHHREAAAHLAAEAATIISQTPTGSRARPRVKLVLSVARPQHGTCRNFNGGRRNCQGRKQAGKCRETEEQR